MAPVGSNTRIGRPHRTPLNDTPFVPQIPNASHLLSHTSIPRESISCNPNFIAPYFRPLLVCTPHPSFFLLSLRWRRGGLGSEGVVEFRGRKPNGMNQPPATRMSRSPVPHAFVFPKPVAPSSLSRIDSGSKFALCLCLLGILDFAAPRPSLISLFF